MKKKIMISVMVICLLVAAVLIFGFMGKIKERPPQKRPPQEEIVSGNSAIFYNLNEEVI